MLAWLKLTGKELAFELSSYMVSPPYVHFVSTHVINQPRPSLFFTALLLPCIILNTNQRTKNGGGLGARLPMAKIVFRKTF